VVFKSALSGIARDPATGVLRALVRDPSAGSQIKAMAAGETFVDGWVVTDISVEAVVLGKGRETRVVRLYG
jgi:hypothetical protein